MVCVLQNGQKEYVYPLRSQLDSTIVVFCHVFLSFRTFLVMRKSTAVYITEIDGKVRSHLWRWSRHVNYCA